MQFHSLHAFFEKLYRSQVEIIDAVAERVRALGAYATATLEEYLGLTRLKEKPGEPPDPRQMILALSADFETLIKEIREVLRAVEGKVDDPSTVSFLTTLLERHEKTLWMLQAHLDRDLV
jgi:starvation-inducible DNA-binding protein